MFPGLTLRNLNTVRHANRQMQNRAGHIHIDRDLDDQKDIENPRRRLHSKAYNLGLIEVATQLKEPSDDEPWSAYHSAGAENEQLVFPHAEKPDNEILGKGAFLTIMTDNLKTFAEKIDLRINTTTFIQHTQRQLHSMREHVLLTLNPSSPALKALRMPNSHREEYLVALKDVVLAIIYLVLLFSVVKAVGNGLRFVMGVFRCIWYPVRTIFAVMEWCVVK